MEPSFLYDRGPSRVKAAAALHGKVFQTDPVHRWLLHNLDAAQQAAYLTEYIGTLLRSSQLNGAIFDEVWLGQPTSKEHDDDEPPACSAVWMPPRCRIDDLRGVLGAGFHRVIWMLGPAGAKRMMIEFQSQSDKAKKMGLVRKNGRRIKDFWYLFYIGTAIEARGQGLASTVIGHVQEKCQKEGLPIWLESTTESSRRLYERLGFAEVRSWLLGVGKVDKDGLPKKGGEGVTIWAMLWKPEGYE